MKKKRSLQELARLDRVMRKCCIGNLGYLCFHRKLEEAGCWEGVLGHILYTGLIVNSVTGMDDALRRTVLLVSGWESVREGVIRQQCVRR